jgi:hypothetical protein
MSHYELGVKIIVPRFIFFAWSVGKGLRELHAFGLRGADRKSHALTAAVLAGAGQDWKFARK